MTDAECFIDSDFISAFLWVKMEDILIQELSGHVILPEQVYRELTHPSIPHFRVKLAKLREENQIKVQGIKIASDEFKIYEKLAITPFIGRVRIGKGEAAALAMAKVRDGIVASNNLKDIMPYVMEYGVRYITVGDILIKAMEHGFITLDDGRFIWNKMLQKKRKLPTNTFEEYMSLKKQIILQ